MCHVSLINNSLFLCSNIYKLVDYTICIYICTLYALLQKTLRETPPTTKETSLITEESPPATGDINEIVVAYLIPVDGPYQINCDGQTGGCFIWNDYGLEINFPPKCSQEHIQVDIQNFLPINNKVHPTIHIVSEVYQFQCNIKRFDKAFTLRLQHCLSLKSPEDCHQLCFIIESENNNDMKHGYFEVGNSYGIVHLNKFCRIFIVWVRALWRNMRTIIRTTNIFTRTVQHQDNSLSSDQQSSTSSEAHTEGLFDVPDVSLNTPIYDTQADIPLKYESMIGLPKNFHHLAEWNCVYSIYLSLGGWNKVRTQLVKLPVMVQITANVMNTGLNPHLTCAQHAHILQGLMSYSHSLLLQSITYFAFLTS